MRACIHRGAAEIGGSCVEVEASSGERLLIDLGLPLDSHEDEASLPQISGLVTSDESLLGILISHAHLDHWGLVPAITESVPIYCGEATERIVAEASYWITGKSIQASGHFEDGETFALGPFAITPYLADHSAFDAYSILIEANGKRLFYTGDIRAHGRKAALFERLLRTAPRNVDALLMEGTHVGEDGEVIHGMATEAEVEAACVQTFRQTKGLALVSYSAQNIDRLVSVYRAAKQAGRSLVVDIYGASIAKATGNQNIPQPGFGRLRVFLPAWQQLRVKETAEFDRRDEVTPWRIYEEELARSPERFVFSFSMPSALRLAKAGALAGASEIWSMWPGYLQEPRGMKLLAFLEQHDIPLVIHHTSGHAPIKDLQRLAQAIDPKVLVPIHTFGASQFAAFFDSVVGHADGTWWEV
jgi:ribonuclease J